jgi:NCAIR mutase (PurE)-related protein
MSWNVENEMDGAEIRRVLEEVKSGEMELDTALDRLKRLPFEDIEFAKIDFHRSIRQGVPEVIYSEGKSVDQIREIVIRLASRHTNVLATRLSLEKYEAIRDVVGPCEYNEAARMLLINPKKVELIGNIAVVAAGTSDYPIAEEAAFTAEALGNKVNRVYDVGVAGIHRLLDHCGALFKANVVIVLAGMEGALASVVGGLVSCPVLGVPTSVGYGASFGGVAALLSMLNSCASGVSVVNIDNGFGAGYQAGLINRLAENRSKEESVHGLYEDRLKPRVAEAS